MKLLLNENLGRSAAEALRRQGHDVIWIGDDFSGTQDQAVLAKAKSEGRILVTKDKDFGELAFKSGEAHDGIILLRLEDEAPANAVRVIEGILARIANRKPPFFIVASDSEFRIRD